MSKQIKQASLTMLVAIEGFMAGEPQDRDESEVKDAVVIAGSFAAAAYEAGTGSGANEYALTRAFLLALIDPTDPALDHLRANPAAGDAARSAALRLSKIAKSS